MLSETELQDKLKLYNIVALAKEIGVDKMTVYRLRNGLPIMPRTYKKISDFFEAKAVS